MGILLLGRNDQKVRRWKDSNGHACDIWAQGGQIMIAGDNQDGVFERTVLTIEYIQHYIANQLIVMAKAKRGLETARTDQARELLHKAYKDADDSLEILVDVAEEAEKQGNPFNPRVMRDRVMEAQRQFRGRRYRNTNAHAGDLAQYQHGFTQLGVHDPSKLHWAGEREAREYEKRLREAANDASGNRVIVPVSKT